MLTVNTGQTITVIASYFTGYWNTLCINGKRGNQAEKKNTILEKGCRFHVLGSFVVWQVASAGKRLTRGY
jgi:hypothetical protein